MPVLLIIHATPAVSLALASTASMLDLYEQQPNATSFGRDLVAALRSMGADLAQSTAPLSRQVGNRTVTIRPIGFSIPPEYVRAVVPAKAQALVTVVPGYSSTYKFQPSPGATPAQLGALERNYYADMERSLFGLTWKKAGWDCLRHLELLAAGCVPLFTDVADAPAGAVAFYPRRVLAQVLRFPGIEALSGFPGLPSAGGARNFSVNMPRVDPLLYSLTVTALLDYTRRHLTTTAMAGHLLATIGISSPHCKRADRDGKLGGLARQHYHGRSLLRSLHPACSRNDSNASDIPTQGGHVRREARILFLSTPEYTGADYMTDTLAHGLVTLLGPDSVVQHPRRDVLYTTPALLYEDKRARVRSSHYGGGFSYAHTLFSVRDSGAASDDDMVEADTRLRAAIAAKEFNAVIFGQAHRGPPSLTKAVCEAYPRSRVAAVYGGDTPPSDKELETYAACAGYFFAREA